MVAEDIPTPPPKSRKQGQKINCPHCETPINTKHSAKLTPVLRLWDAVCPNPQCGAIFFGSTVIEGESRPSLSPNPTIKLPQGNRRKAEIPA